MPKLLSAVVGALLVAQAHAFGDSSNSSTSSSLLAAASTQRENCTCDTAANCTQRASDLFYTWMMGFELGPGNETTGSAFRAATYPDGACAAARAVKLAPNSSDAAVVMTQAFLLDFQFERAMDAAHRAVRLNASSPQAWNWLSKAQTAMLQLDAAHRSAATAVRLDPNAEISLGGVLYMQRRWDDLRKSCLHIVARQPTNIWGWDWLGMAYVGLGENERSLAAYDVAIAIASNISYPITDPVSSRAHTLAVMGETAEAERALRKLYEQAHKRYIEPVRIAFVESGLGHVDAALARLHEAAELKLWEMSLVRTEPWFDPVRQQRPEGYAELIKRIGFPP